MSTIASRTFTQAFNDARAELRDQAAQRYTDSVLLPLGANVHGELQECFVSDDRQFAEKVVDTFTYTAGDDTIKFAGTTDMYEPIELWQRNNTGSIWIPIPRVFRVAPPWPSPTGYITMWEWSGVPGIIKVPPCELTTLILARYSVQMDYPATAGAVMGVEGFYYPLVQGVCMKAARMTNRYEAAASFRQEYLRLTQQALLRGNRVQQGIPMRWSGYRPRRGGRTVVLIAQ